MKFGQGKFPVFVIIKYQVRFPEEECKKHKFQYQQLFDSEKLHLRKNIKAPNINLEYP